jgi:hypothetical protein
MIHRFAMGDLAVFVGLFASFLAVFPLWRIFKRAGVIPGMSAVVFLPFIGYAAAALALALNRWPNIEGDAKEPRP